MEKFIITREMLKKANTYMPIGTKADVARTIAKNTLSEMPAAEQNKEGEKILALPYLKTESYAIKQLQLMSVLLTFYLDVELTAPFTEDDYDLYASSRLLAQLEGFKKDAEVKEIAFAILADYKELEKAVNIEIYNQRCTENDSIARFTAGMSIMADPENVKKLYDELKKAADELGEKQKAIKEKAAENHKKGEKS